MLTVYVTFQEENYSHRLAICYVSGIMFSIKASYAAMQYSQRNKLWRQQVKPVLYVLFLNCQKKYNIQYRKHML